MRNFFISKIKKFLEVYKTFIIRKVKFKIQYIRRLRNFYKNRDLQAAIIAEK